jgi:hypothetical protein
MWAVKALAAALLVGGLAACDAPFGLPSTRALEDGAAGSLSSAQSFEITGAYLESGTQSSIDMALDSFDHLHVAVTRGDVKLEAIVIAGDAYFRGKEFLSQHMGQDTNSRNLVAAAGNGWWKGPASQVPRLPEFVDGPSFRTAFLGTVVTERSDHQSVDGVDAVELSGPRADVFIAAQPPHRVLRVQLTQDAVIDGIQSADFNYSNFDKDFGITVPSDVIDFANLSTLPPLYTVVSVNASKCASPCVVSALLKNLGGTVGAQAPSTVTFTLTESATGKVLGSCQVEVQPDVGFNATKTVSCTIAGLSAPPLISGTVTAKADNPGRA